MASILDGISTTNPQYTAQQPQGGSFVDPTGKQAIPGAYWAPSGGETPIQRWQDDNSAVIYYGGQAGKFDQGGNFVPVNYNSAPSSINAPASGGGGYNYAAEMARKRQEQIDARKNQMIEGINTRYNDLTTDFNKGEELIRTETGMNKDYVSQTRDLSLQKADQGEADAVRQARRNYQDSIVATRRRIRATGAGSSSGFLELTNLLDRELSGSLTGIQTNAQNIKAGAMNTAQKALQDLDLSLQKALAGIESDRRTSAREKEQAIREAEMAAADQAIAVDEWLSNTQARFAASSAASQNQAQQSSVMQAYLTDMGRAQNNQIGMTPQQVAQYYAPLLAASGANPNTVNAYGQMTGYSQGLTDDEKFMYDMQYKYDNLNAKNQTDPLDEFYGYYDPYKYGTGFKGFNPIVQYLYPDQYNQFQTPGATGQ